MEALSELETRVLEKLLDGDQPVLAALRGQFAACCAHHRDFTGVGFVAELHVPEDVASAPVETTHVRFADVVAELRGVEHGVGFVLFIERGRMIALEAYTFDEPWPAKGGAALGGLLGSGAPGLGNAAGAAIGGLVGGLVGSIAGGFFGSWASESVADAALE